MNFEGVRVGRSSKGVWVPEEGYAAVELLLRSVSEAKMPERMAMPRVPV